MGYEIHIDQNTKKWLCRLPDGSDVGLFDFYYGKAGQDYSYCAKKGYKAKSYKISKGIYSLRFPVCFEEDGEMKHLHKLMDELGDYYEMFDDPLGAPPPPDTLPDPEELPDPPPPEPPDPDYDPFFRWDDPDENYMNPPEDQGSSGTCYAHATASAADGAYNKFYDYTSASSRINLSQAFLAFCGRQDETSCWYGLHGSEGVANFDYDSTKARVDYNNLPQMMVATHGLILEDKFPWNSVSCGPPQENDPSCTHWDNKRIRFKRFGNVDTTRVAIKQALLDYGPLIASVDNTDNFPLYTESPNDTTTMALGNTIWGSEIDTHSPMAHAVCIVGWGYANGQHYWVIHNSLTSWGANGVGRVLYNTAGIMYEVAYLQYLPATIEGSDLASELNRITNLDNGVESHYYVDVKWGYKSFSCELDTDIPASRFQYPIVITDQPNVDFPLKEQYFGSFTGRWDTLKFYIEYEKGGIPNSCEDLYNFDTITKPVWVGNPAIPEISGPSQMECSSTATFSISNLECIQTSLYFEWSSSWVSIVGNDFEPSCTVQSYTGGQGTITVKVINGHGESFSETFNITVLDCPMMSMVIFPNPAKDELNVEVVTESDPDDSFDFELRDNHGNKRKIKHKAGKKIQWSISDLPEGTYFVKVKGRDKDLKIKQEKTEQVIISR